MKFSEAFEKMKMGCRMKRPSWGGYWTWECDTIMMHCLPNKVDLEGVDTTMYYHVAANDIDLLEHVAIDIRATKRVNYTMQNIGAEDWIEANDQNCTLMGGIPQFDFETALSYMKRGMKVTRASRTFVLKQSDIEANDWTFYNN